MLKGEILTQDSFVMADVILEPIPQASGPGVFAFVCWLLKIKY